MLKSWVRFPGQFEVFAGKYKAGFHEQSCDFLVPQHWTEEVTEWCP